MTADLTAWFRACLDDDEQAAQAAIVNSIEGRYDGEVWSVVDREVRTDDGSRSGVAIARTRHDDPGAAVHIARWDPARVLAEVAAKRAILDEHAIIHRDIGWLDEDDGDRVENYAELPVCVRCVPKHSHFPRREDVPVGPCRTVRALVQPLTGRAGFDPSWLD